jgi:hypothetical protein
MHENPFIRKGNPMRLLKLFSTLLLAAVAMAGTRAYSQADVTESQATPIFVDSEKGSDLAVTSAFSSATNVGTIAAPLQSIQAAINLANTRIQNNVATKIVVNPGVYRESLNLEALSGQTSAALTIEAATAGAAVVSGSDVVSGWQKESGHPSIWEHSWQYNFGTCAIPRGWPGSIPTIVRRTEMIFANGHSLTQVMSSSSLKAGTFYVGSGRIYVYPQAGTNMSTAKVEVAVRSNILTISGRSNVVLRGITLQHSRSCINTSGSVINASTNVLVDGVQAAWNNWGGLAILSSRNVTVQNSNFSYNGGVGFQGYQLVGATLNSNKSNFNNWRGAQGSFYNWGMGGTKIMLGRNITVNNHHSYGNHAQGLWFDTDNKNITVNNAYLSNNYLSSMQLEANEGPVVVKNSHLCNSGMGVTVLNNDKLTIENTTFYNDGGTGLQYNAEIFIAGRPGGHRINDWQTGQSYDLFTKDTLLTGNTIENTRSGQDVFGTYLSGGDWSDFGNSLNASKNKWYNPATTSAFKLPSNHTTNFAGWKSAVGTDYSSSWSKPSTSPAGACAVAAQ